MSTNKIEAVIFSPPCMTRPKLSRFRPPIPLLFLKKKISQGSESVVVQKVSSECGVQILHWKE